MKKLDELARELVENKIRPSGADLQNYVERLIEYAYDISSCSDNAQLKITEYIINYVCDVMSKPYENTLLNDLAPVNYHVELMTAIIAVKSVEHSETKRC